MLSETTEAAVVCVVGIQRFGQANPADVPIMASAGHPEIPYSGVRSRTHPARRFSEVGLILMMPSKSAAKKVSCLRI